MGQRLLRPPDWLARLTGSIGFSRLAVTAMGTVWARSGSPGGATETGSVPVRVPVATRSMLSCSGSTASPKNGSPATNSTSGRWTSHHRRDLGTERRIAGRTTPSGRESRLNPVRSTSRIAASPSNPTSSS